MKFFNRRRPEQEIISPSETEYYVRKDGNVTYVTAKKETVTMTYFKLNNGTWFMQMPTGPEGEDIQINAPTQSEYLNSIISDYGQRN